MGEKLVAGIVTAAVISPICSVCVLGPAAIGSLIGGAFGWVAGAGPILTIGIMLAAGVLVWRSLRRRRMRMLPGREGYSDAASLATQAIADGSRAPDSRSEVGAGRPQELAHSR